MLQIHEIRYFLAVSDTLNFTRAAERCNVTQPALTRAIKSLEDKLGAGPLILRDRGNTRLTELGSMMRPHFEHMQSELESARTRAKDYARVVETSLRIGLMCTIGPARLVDFFSRFSQDYPDIDINLADGPVPVIEAKLENGELDGAIYACPDELDARFHGVPLFEERFVVAVPPLDPLAQQNSIRIPDLNQKHYLGRASCEFYDHLRRIRLEIGGIEFKRRYVSDRDDWVQAMVVAGLGFTYLPEFAVMMPGLVVRPLVDPEVRRTVQFVTMRGRQHSSAVGAFVRKLRSHAWAGKLPPPATPELMGQSM